MGEWYRRRSALWCSRDCQNRLCGADCDDLPISRDSFLGGSSRPELSVGSSRVLGMSSTTVVGPVPVVDLIGSLHAVVEGLVEAEWWRLTGQESADSLEEMESVFRLLEFARSRELADFHARDFAGQHAGLSTGVFLQARLRLSAGEAKARVRTSQELEGSVSISGEIVEPELPATAAAASEGALSTEHVRVIGEAMKRLPAAVGVRERAEAEQFLAEQSREMDPRRVRILARRLHAVLDPDGTLDEDKPDRRELIFRRDVGGMDYIRGRLDSEASATVQAALGALAQPEPAQDGVPDSRSRSRRMADAWVELCGRALADGGLPTVGGEKPQVTVTIALDDLRGKASDQTLRRPGTGTLNTGAPITAEAARRIACDASIIPILLGSASEPLDIGRASRTIPTGIRRAVVARDIGCIHPGCTSPAAWCQTHHVKHWSDGGPTSLNNLVLLSHHHHWIVHHEGWQITFNEGIPHVIPPPLVDPRQRPRRNTMHDQPGLPSG